MDCETLWMDSLPPTPQIIVGGNQFGANEGYDPYHHLHHCHASSSSLSAPPPYVTCPIDSLQAGDGVQWYMQPLCVINSFPYKMTL